MGSQKGLRVLILENQIDISPLLKAADSFQSAMKEVTTDLTRDGAIQRFEYTFELCWKTMKRILRSKGSEVNHPKDVFREAVGEKLIEDPILWFGYLENRKKTTHIYKDDVAREVFAVLPAFAKSLEGFLLVVKKL